MGTESPALSLPKRIEHQNQHALWTGSELLSWTQDLNAHESLSQNEWLQQSGNILARLTMALHPHAKHIWLCCGPGRNGLDGWHAAHILKTHGKTVSITALGSPPADLGNLHDSVRATPPQEFDIAVDALFGIGLSRSINASEAAGQWILRMHSSNRPLVFMDLPSGLCPSTGRWLGPELIYSRSQKDTLAMLGMSVGLWTHEGRDCAGQVWLSECQVNRGSTLVPSRVPNAHLIGECPSPVRSLNSHKGTYGHVIVMGGSAGMRGAGLLAARSALTHGAGVVHWFAPDGQAAQFTFDLNSMPIQTLDRWPKRFQSQDVVVAGCGAGSLPEIVWDDILGHSPQLVLDADGLNAVASSAALKQRLMMRQQRQLPTVITPHPLEAARLLSCSTKDVQADRLNAARNLSQTLGCVTLLKGSGTVIAQTNGTCWINSTGNARLATAGSGDVLAGCLGAMMAQGMNPVEAAKRSAYVMGKMAEQKAQDPSTSTLPLTADQQAMARLAI